MYYVITTSGASASFEDSTLAKVESQVAEYYWDMGTPTVQEVIMGGGKDDIEVNLDADVSQARIEAIMNGIRIQEYQSVNR